MNYEKLHKDTIAKLQEMVNSGKITVEIARGICADFVPESEGEKIRKNLITFLKKNYGTNSNACFVGIKVRDILAWLEKQGEHANFRNKIQIGDKVTRNEDGVLVNLSQLKRVAKKDEQQGEQKPIDTKNLETAISNILKVYSHIILHRSLTQDELNETDVYAAENTKKLLCFLEQKSAEWNEEDEHCRHQLIVFCENCMVQDSDAKKCANWLKSLKDRYTWKPSDEQMKILQYLCEHSSHPSPNVIPTLESLYEQLKAL